MYDYEDLRRKYSRLDVLPDNSMDLKIVKLVLGQNNYHMIFTVEHQKGKRIELWAVKTKLWWTLRGLLPMHEVTQVGMTNHVATVDDGSNEQLKTSFIMESYAKKMNARGRSKVNNKILGLLEKSMKLVEGCYEVGLSCERDNPTLQNKYLSAHSQFCSLERRLGKEDFLMQQYNETTNVNLQNVCVCTMEDKELD